MFDLKTRFNFTRIDFSHYFLFLIAIIPILAPYYFLQHATIGILFDYWTYLAMAIFAAYVFIHYKQLSSTIMAIIMTYVLLLAVTAYNNGEIIAVVKHSIKVILLCCMVDALKDDEKRMNSFLYVIRDITLVLFIANIATCMIWKSGIPSITQNYLYPYHLFGNVNTTIRVVLPGMLCSTLINHFNKKRFNLASLIYLAGYIYIYLVVYPTTTTLIAVFILTIWIAFEGIFKKHSSQIYFVAICAILVLELFIVVLSNTNLIGFIASLFNKSTDFTGRAFLWSRTMASIREHYIFGIGRQSLSEIRTTIGNVSGSHNYFLDILYQRGIIGLALFLVLILRPILIIRRGNKENSSVIYTVIGYCICLLAMFLSEPFFEYEYYFIPIFYSLYTYTRSRSSNRLSES